MKGIGRLDATWSGDLRTFSVGGAPATVLLAPWPQTALAYKRSLVLPAAIEDCVVVELPGFGLSDARPETGTPEGMAAFLGRFLDSLGERSVHLVAPRVWGPLAVRVAALRPAKIASLVLTGIVNGPGWLRFLSAAIEHSTCADEQPALELVDRLIGYAPADPEYQEYWRAGDAGRFAHQFLFLTLVAAGLFDEEHPLVRPGVPLLALCGLRDDLMRGAAVDPLLASWATARVYLDCGHFLWEEQPSVWAGVLAWWVSGGRDAVQAPYHLARPRACTPCP